MRGVKLYII